MSDLEEGRILVTNQDDISEGRADGALPTLPPRTDRQNYLMATAGDVANVTANIPAEANFVKVGVTPQSSQVAVSTDSANPAVFPVANVTDGTASEIDPVIVSLRARDVDGNYSQVDHLSFTANVDATVVNLSFYK